jgi:hypothetical protein
MRAQSYRSIITLFSGMLALGIADVWAAKAPLTPEELKQQASLIVTGTVVELTSKDQQSKVETAFGNHVDRVFTIKLKVTKIAKGSGVKAAEVIDLEAWKPIRRLPPLPGLQGHTTIPSKGETVTVYLKRKQANAYEPILPNGIVIVNKDGAANSDPGNAALNRFHQELRKVLAKHFPRASSHVFDDKIHFEHATRLYVARAIAKTPLGQQPPLVEVRGPNNDGVWCEIRFREGFVPYARSEGATDRQHFTEYIYYPHFQDLDCHLYVTLRLPSGAEQQVQGQFLADFRKLLESFDDNQ